MDTGELMKLVGTLAKRYAALRSDLQAYGRLGQSPSAVFQREEILHRVKRLLPPQTEGDLRQGLEAWLRSEEELVQKAVLEAGHRLALELEEALAKHGIKLTGQLPQLQAGCLTLKINQTTRTVDLFLGPELVRSGIRLNAQAIATAVRSVISGLDSAPFDPQRFLALLYEACRQLAAEGSGRGAGSHQVPLPEVFLRTVLLRQPSKFRRNPTRENFTPYARWQFGYDLLRLRESGVRRIEGKEYELKIATLDAARNRERYIWVPDDRSGRGTRYAYLAFGGPHGS
jgi:hypothetical protein